MNELVVTTVLFPVRRQAAEEREAERQHTNRILLNLHSNGLLNETPTTPLYNTNASLCALENIKPWAERTKPVPGGVCSDTEPSDEGGPGPTDSTAEGGGALSAAGGADMEDSSHSDIEDHQQHYNMGSIRMSVSRSRSVSPVMLSPGGT